MPYDRERKECCSCLSDCQDPDNGLVSMECSVHNENSRSNPICPVHGDK
jgi:hypothetical protein